ncbi:hypothetical protein PIB30_067509 [Stylosanthes scabra]|uniref:Bifunctional inhibitor/plant lipid transfer protein/seed storage helical domain-containing protein n=1 Tax=Stylosanthes scabra TaxID=79078 RepID=A0ABU6ULK4_9FABA|nr:hypothetical protein [Stylosanthes scabra]
MASKALTLFLIFSSIIYQGYSQSLDELLGNLGGNNAALKEAQCMQKLVPCNKYMKDSSNVAEECCAPMRELASSDQQCLCSFFNNQDMLNSLKVSKEDALKLPNACSVHVDIATCPADTKIDSSKMAPQQQGESSSATGLTRFGVPSFVALLAAAAAL